jgi:ferredoxin
MANITLTVFNGENRHELHVPAGSNLRQVLLAHDLSPYAALTQRANCGGGGLCATCGVWLDEAPAPTHWHDRIGNQFGYPRLSCQITVDHDLTVHLIPEKWIWGGRKR